MTAVVTNARTKSRDNLVCDSSGAPLDQALRKLPGDNMSNAPELVATGSIAWTPDIGSGGMTGLVYLDGRMSSDYKTGFDLFPQKEQEGYRIVNARVGVPGPDESGARTLGAPTLVNQQYAPAACTPHLQK